MYMGTVVPIKLMEEPVNKLTSPSGLNCLKVIYSGSIMVWEGMTIIITTQPNISFFKGKSNLANPYPTMEQTKSCSRVRVRVWSKS